MVGVFARETRGERIRESCAPLVFRRFFASPSAIPVSLAAYGRKFASYHNLCSPPPSLAVLWEDKRDDPIRGLR